MKSEQNKVSENYQKIKIKPAMDKISGGGICIILTG